MTGNVNLRRERWIIFSTLKMRFESNAALVSNLDIMFQDWRAKELIHECSNEHNCHSFNAPENVLNMNKNYAFKDLDS